MAVTEKDRVAGGARRRAASGWTLAALAVALVLLAPSLTVLASLVLPASENWAHLRATVLPTYVANTLWLMLLVALMAGVIGVGTAWLVVAARFPGQRIFNWALVLPLATPDYIIAYVYTDLLAFAGPVQGALRGLTGWSGGDYAFPNIRSLPGAAIMLSLVLYPYVYLLARTAFQRQSAALFEAARMLGARPWRAFIRVALPCARPAIAGGLALALMETISDFGVVDYFAVPTLTTGIVRTWFSLGDAAGRGSDRRVAFLFALALVSIELISCRGRVANPLARDMAARPAPLTRRTGRGRDELPARCRAAAGASSFRADRAAVRYAFIEGDPLGRAQLASRSPHSRCVAGVAAVLATALALLLAVWRAPASDAL